MAVPIWITSTLCPTVGVVICTIMWLAALPAILHARKTLDLGSLNPMPFLAMIFNCIGWIIYSMQRRDFYIFFSNFTGITLGIFYITSSTRILGRRNDRKSLELAATCENLLTFIVGFWSLMGMVAGIVYSPSSYDQKQAATFIGALSVFASITFYAAPLSTVWEVFSIKDSKSLYFPALIMNFTNGMMWFIYGISGIHDPLVWAPNLLGAGFAVTQMILLFIYTKGSIYEAVTGATTKAKVALASNNSTSLVVGQDEHGQEAMNPIHTPVDSSDSKYSRRNDHKMLQSDDDV